MPKHTDQRDPYTFHRTALAPVLPGATRVDLENSLGAMALPGEQEFTDFLLEQGLAPLWGKAMESTDPCRSLPQDFKQVMHRARLESTGSYLIQHNWLAQIKRILDEANVLHVVYKGADIRERYYPEPALRPAVDIDILVASEQRITAIKALANGGFTFHAEPANISHETNLIKGATSIDLHWDIMRPGRTRRNMVDALLTTRRDYGTHWGMSDEANLFVMLVHPVFAKYSTAPQAALMRAVDLVQITEKAELRWEETIELLATAGLKTAAWITLRWLQLVTGRSAGPEVMAALQPGTLRRLYLNRWLERNLATRFLNRPALVQLGFTLPAHDRASDALRAIRLKRQADKSAAAELRDLTRMLA